MKRFDLYGSGSLSVHDIAQALDECGLATFTERESSYKGGVYFLHKVNSEKISVQANGVDPEGFRAEPDFSDMSTLVYVSGSDRWTELEETFRAIGLELLRTEQV